MDKPSVSAGGTGGLKPAKSAPPVKKVRKAETGDQVKHTLIQIITEYFLSLRYEWQKITFPTRKEWIQATIVVFLFTLVLMAVISVYDAGMSLFFSKFILPVSVTTPK